MPPVIWLSLVVYVGLCSTIGCFNWNVSVILSHEIRKWQKKCRKNFTLNQRCWYHKTFEMILIIKCDDNSQVKKHSLTHSQKEVNRKNLCLTLVIECFSCLLICGCLRAFCRMVMVCFLLLISSSWKKMNTYTLKYNKNSPSLGMITKCVFKFHFSPITMQVLI